MSTVRINLIFSSKFFYLFEICFSHFSSDILKSLFKLDLLKTDLYTRYKSTSPCDIIPWIHEWHQNLCLYKSKNTVQLLLTRKENSSIVRECPHVRIIGHPSWLYSTRGISLKFLPFLCQNIQMLISIKIKFLNIFKLKIYSIYYCFFTNNHSSNIKKLN